MATCHCLLAMIWTTAIIYQPMILVLLHHRQWSWRSTSTRIQWSTWSLRKTTNFTMWRTTAASFTSLQKWAPPVRKSWPSPGPNWAWAMTGRHAKKQKQKNTPQTLQIRAVWHIPLVSVASKVVNVTAHTPWALPSSHHSLCDSKNKDALQD